MGSAGRLRAVLDTNVVVSALLFETGRVAWIRHAWKQARFVPLTDEPCAAELLRLLGYPKFRLQARSAQVLMGAYLPYSELVPPTEAACLARSPDRDDQKFLDLAVRGDAGVLVTGDTRLRALEVGTAFAIESPEVFRRRLGLYRG